MKTIIKTLQSWNNELKWLVNNIYECKTIDCMNYYNLEKKSGNCGCKGRKTLNMNFDDLIKINKRFSKCGKKRIFLAIDRTNGTILPAAFFIIQIPFRINYQICHFILIGESKTWKRKLCQREDKSEKEFIFLFYLLEIVLISPLTNWNSLYSCTLTSCTLI